MPELGPAFRIAVSPFFFNPHSCWQDQIRSLCSNSWIRIRDDDKCLWISITGQSFLIQVRGRLHVIITHNPIGVDLSVFQHTALLNSMITRFCRNNTRRDFPDFFSYCPMLRVHYYQICRQAVGKGSDFPCRSAGRRLARKRERRISRRRDFSSQKVNVINQIIAPHASGMLIEPHSPEGDNFSIRVSIEFSKLNKGLFRNARKLGDFLNSVLCNKGFKFFEAYLS